MAFEPQTYDVEVEDLSKHKMDSERVIIEGDSRICNIMVLH